MFPSDACDGTFDVYDDSVEEEKPVETSPVKTSPEGPEQFKRVKHIKGIYVQFKFS